MKWWDRMPWKITVILLASFTNEEIEIQIKWFSQDQKMGPKIDPRSSELSHVLLPILGHEARGCRAEDHKEHKTGNQKTCYQGMDLAQTGCVIFDELCTFLISTSSTMKWRYYLSSLWRNTMIMKTTDIKALYKLEMPYKWLTQNATSQVLLRGDCPTMRL